MLINPLRKSTCIINCGLFIPLWIKSLSICFLLWKRQQYKQSLWFLLQIPIYLKLVFLLLLMFLPLLISKINRNRLAMDTFPLNNSSCGLQMKAPPTLYLASFRCKLMENRIRQAKIIMKRSTTQAQMIKFFKKILHKIKSMWAIRKHFLAQDIIIINLPLG